MGKDKGEEKLAFKKLTYKISKNEIKRIEESNNFVKN